MELKRLKCPTCGASIDGNTIDLTKKTAKCPACDETFIIEQAENFALVEVDKTKDIANYRRNLALATEKDDAESIKRYAEKILDILPEDYEAGYFYAYANAKSGDSRYLYDFYNDFDREYTEESCMRVAEHIVRHGELRDNVLIEKYLKNLKYSAESYLLYYKQVFNDKLSKEELYDDITRDVFICHRSIDGKVAEKIVKELEDDGNKCWISSRNLRPNDNENYWDNIKKAIKSCRIFLVVSSRSAMISTDVKKELAYAKDLNKRRLEVKIDDSEHTALFKDFFDGCKWIKGVNKDEILERVADLLSKELSGKESVVVHKVKKVDFTPIQAAKPVEKKIINDLHEHKFQKIQVVPPTCTESGYTIYRCGCGAEKKGDFTPKRTEHEFKVAERKEPTCIENGYIKYECVYCDATKKDVLPATGHKYKLSDKKEPTCKEEGHEIYTCSVCGDTTVKTLPKTAHPFGRWIVTKIAECESQGEESRQCSFCGKTETRSVPAKGHNYGKWVTEKEPTCTEKGVKARLCTDCGKKDYSDIEPTGHSFSAWQNLPDGKTQERTCQVCGYTETRNTDDWYRMQGFIVHDGILLKYKLRNENVKIPEGIIEIGDRAFYGCNVKTVYLPDGIKSIGESAFYGCKYLESINIPTTLTRISAHAFHGCEKLDDNIIKIIKEINYFACQTKKEIELVKKNKEELDKLSKQGILKFIGWTLICIGIILAIVGIAGCAKGCDGAYDFSPIWYENYVYDQQELQKAAVWYGLAFLSLCLKFVIFGYSACRNGSALIDKSILAILGIILYMLTFSILEVVMIINVPSVRLVWLILGETAVWLPFFYWNV